MTSVTVIDHSKANANQNGMLDATQSHSGMALDFHKEFADQIGALRPMLVRIAHKRLRNEAWAEDAVSETLVAALEKPGAFAGRAMVRTWLVGILKYKVVDQIRRHTRECQVEFFDDEFGFGDLSNASPNGADEARAKWNDPQECLSQRQFMMQFDRCLKELPPREARAFVLHHWFEEETADICNQLGISTSNLYVILHRARNRLRVSLRTQFVPVPGGRRLS